VLQGSAVLVWIASLVNICVSIAVAYLVAALSPNLAIACMVLASYGITITFFLGTVLQPRTSLQPMFALGWW
jgi:hypothetical protein